MNSFFGKQDEKFLKDLYKEEAEEKIAQLKDLLVKYRIKISQGAPRCLCISHLPIYLCPSFIYLSIPTQMYIHKLYVSWVSIENLFLNNSVSQQNNLEVDMLSINSLPWLHKEPSPFYQDLPPSSKFEPSPSLSHEC